ncbi:MAG: VapC toxin family PIN domain ribonuclease [Gammaproteobacteria bacterium]|nr:MAG: VapC toxin family PIN domain ribonuclease [Gammaproteobacteria bacterium]
MILVDTSVWVDHLRRGEEGLSALLNGGQVLSHSFVIGELACGNLRNRAEVLDLLQKLPQVPLASQEEVLFFVQSNALMGQGIGFVDAHLLASTALAGASRIWSYDKSLTRVASDLHLDYQA